MQCFAKELENITLIFFQPVVSDNAVNTISDTSGKKVRKKKDKTLSTL